MKLRVCVGILRPLRVESHSTELVNFAYYMTIIMLEWDY